jgi:hypothetical protein
MEAATGEEISRAIPMVRSFFVELGTPKAAPHAHPSLPTTWSPNGTKKTGTRVTSRTYTFSPRLMSMRRPTSSCFISQADLNNPSDLGGAARILVFCWDSVEGAPRGPCGFCFTRQARAFCWTGWGKRWQAVPTSQWEMALHREFFLPGMRVPPVSDRGRWARSGLRDVFPLVGRIGRLRRS